MRLLPRSALDIAPDETGEQARIMLAASSPKAEAVVSGLAFEALVALEPNDAVEGYLLFLTHDRPNEETLSITLLTPELSVLDTARIEFMYGAGLFSDLRIVGANRLAFRFPDDRQWSLELLPRPVVRLPFLSEPAGLRHQSRWTRHFVLTRAVAPD